MKYVLKCSEVHTSLHWDCTADGHGYACKVLGEMGKEEEEENGMPLSSFKSVMERSIQVQN